MIFLSQPIPDAGRKLPANLVRSSKWSGHSPFKAAMLGSSPARITIWCLRLMDRTPASQAGNMGSTPVGITTVFKWNCSSRVECGPGKPRDAGSSPASSTIRKNPNLPPFEGLVWILCYPNRNIGRNNASNHSNHATAYPAGQSAPRISWHLHRRSIAAEYRTFGFPR